MSNLYNQTLYKKNVKLYFPESFEWLILKSEIINKREILDVLSAPEEYIETREYFSWERFFTRLLMDITEETYLKYGKNKLNPVYLHEKNKAAILESMEGIELSMRKD